MDELYFYGTRNRSAIPFMDYNRLLHDDIVNFYNKGMQATSNLYNQLMAPVMQLFNYVANNPVNLSAIAEPTRILKDNFGTYSVSPDNFLSNFNWGDWQKAMMLKWFFKYGNPFVQGYRDIASSQNLLTDAFLNRPVSAIREYQTSYIEPDLMREFTKKLFGY